MTKTEEDPARLWAEIHKLRSEAQGPAGHATWKDAATAERARRAELQVAYDETVVNNLGGMDNQCMRLARAALRTA